MTVAVGLFQQILIVEYVSTWVVCAKGGMTYSLKIHTIIDLLNRVHVVTDEKPILFRENVVDEIDERFDAATLEGDEIGGVADHDEPVGVNSFWIGGRSVS